MGNLYEETLTGTANPPYTCYYYLGSKMVGLRRASQTNASTNGQYRMVGDHLGSTTLLVDTASPPNVVQRQYYKPYGEVAWSSGGGLTSYGYTGQRLDGDSGLMYYGARYYDPALSYFIAADSVVPGTAGDSSGVSAIDQQSSSNSKRSHMLTVAFSEPQFIASLSKENAHIADEIAQLTRPQRGENKGVKQWEPPASQALNRYAYTLNNPLRYTDPTGHYDYTYTFLIGYSRQGVTARSAMALIQQDPNRFFPFEVQGMHFSYHLPVIGWVPSGDNRIKLGGVYYLSNFPLFSNSPVQVTSLSPTSFTFTALPGHFDPTGSTVTFTTFEKDGAVFVQFTGKTFGQVGPIQDFLAPIFAHQTWAGFATNLQNYYLGLPKESYPPYAREYWLPPHTEH